MSPSHSETQTHPPPHKGPPAPRQSAPRETSHPDKPLRAARDPARHPPSLSTPADRAPKTPRDSSPPPTAPHREKPAPAAPKPSLPADEKAPHQPRATITSAARNPFPAILTRATRSPPSYPRLHCETAAITHRSPAPVSAPAPPYIADTACDNTSYGECRASGNIALPATRAALRSQYAPHRPSSRP